MAMLMPRRSSCSLCRSLVVSSGGRYPCVMYNFILGNRQQTTVVFKAGQKRLHHTTNKASLSVLSKHSCVSNFPKQNQVSDIVCKISCFKVLSNISRIVASVPPTDILSTTVQRDKWAGSTVKPYEFTLLDLRLSAGQNPFTQDYIYCYQKQVEPGLNIPE